VNSQYVEYIEGRTLKSWGPWILCW